jgi:endonuclease/exonuclease/phosphatase family metal-dependent hydrolase
MRSILIVKGAALALGLSACVSGGRGAGEPLRVLVYNIHAGTDAKRVDNLARVAEIVKKSRADIVLLQEVDSATRRSGRVDQVARLRSLTRFHGVFGRTIDYDGGAYGIAILSRWPIVADTLIHLPVKLPPDSAAAYEARGALVAEIAAPREKLRVVDTHLDAHRDAYRLQQVLTLIEVAGVQRDSGETIVGGDFNSEPASGVVGIFARAGWRDAYIECGKGSGLSFPASLPVKRIDYLLISGRTGCRTAEVLATEASDHRPVLFEITYGKR